MIDIQTEKNQKTDQKLCVSHFFEILKTFNFLLLTFESSLSFWLSQVIVFESETQTSHLTSLVNCFAGRNSAKNVSSVKLLTRYSAHVFNFTSLFLSAKIDLIDELNPPPCWYNSYLHFHSSVKKWNFSFYEYHWKCFGKFSSIY